MHGILSVPSDTVILIVIKCRKHPKQVILLLNEKTTFREFCPHDKGLMESNRFIVMPTELCI